MEDGRPCRIFSVKTVAFYWLGAVRQNPDRVLIYSHTRGNWRRVKVRNSASRLYTVNADVTTYDATIAKFTQLLQFSESFYKQNHVGSGFKETKNHEVKNYART